MFDLIALSEQRKFLSRQKAQDAKSAAQVVYRLLQSGAVGSVSVRRVDPNKRKDVDDVPS